MMKKYLVFAGSNYYPAGGMEDFIDDFDDKEDALNAIRAVKAKNDADKYNDEWAYIYNTETRKDEESLRDLKDDH